MLKYLIFITIGILLYLLLNIYNTFSIGVPTYYFVPYTEGMTTIDQSNVLEITTTPEQTGESTTLQYYRTNEIARFDDELQKYWVTTINPNNQENIDTILRDIREIQEQDTPHVFEPTPETEQERIAREERERQERERQERERQERQDFLTMMRQPDDNLFKNGDIVIFTDRTGYVELQITTVNPRGTITGGATGGVMQEVV